MLTWMSPPPRGWDALLPDRSARRTAPGGRTVLPGVARVRMGGPVARVGALP
jgi:hypothetical protein